MAGIESARDIRRGSEAPPRPGDVPVAGAIAGIVDDDPVARQILSAWAASRGWSVREFATAREALAGAGACDVVCLDLGLGDMHGLDVLKHLRAADADATVVVVTADREVETAVKAMRSGAYDYLTKPLDRQRTLTVLDRALERRQLLSRVRAAAAGDAGTHALAGMVGESPPMGELVRQVRNVIESDVSVCVFGESGTGKEIVARAIHLHGRRRQAPFVPVNCAAIPQSLHESELFGHERGAFTGAVATHRGRFEQAHGGTLFLDEVGEMSTMTQASLLRALQERTIRRVGGTSDIAVNVRVVCATHRDLEHEVKVGRFREDLYFRLVVYPIVVPPLRDRPGDVPLLVAHMLRSFAADVRRPVTRVSPAALDALSQYPWPGNVRELQNAVHRAMLACGGDEIELAHLPASVRGGLPVLPPGPAPADVPRSEPEPVLPLREVERRAMARALEATQGNVTHAARLLGVGRATLYRRLAELTGSPGAPREET